jgi:hypothetical protein
MSQSPSPEISQPIVVDHLEDAVNDLENSLPNNPPELEAGYSEFEQFDWQAWQASTTENLAIDEEAQPNNRELQNWLSQRLTLEAIEAVVKEVPVKSLWEWLSQKDQRNFRTQLLRGFQQTPQLLRNPAVRNRLIKFLDKERKWVLVYVLLWGEKIPPHPLVDLLNNETDDSVIIHRLPSIFKEFGPHLLLCAAAYNGRPLLFKIIYDFIQSPTELFEQEIEPTILEEPTNPTQEVNSEEKELKAEVSPQVIELKRAKDNIERLTAHNEILSTQLKALQKENASLIAKEKQLITQWEKKFELGIKKAENEISELKRREERLTRKLTKAERERDEFEAELKKTKKQLRNTQQVLESERKNTSLLSSKIDNSQGEAKTEQKPPTSSLSRPQLSPPTAAVKSNSPLDEIFQWQADGRRIQISPRQIKRLIDQNKEDELYLVQMALEVLEANNKELYNRFLHRLGTIDLSYRQVLTSPTQRVLVDASNVARSQLKNGRGMLKLLISVRDELRSRGAWPIIMVADASLRHNIDEGKKFQEMISSGEIIQSDKGVEADEILAREARRTGASVVTNDVRFFHKVSADFEPPRISFRLFDGTVLVNDF